MPKAKKIPFENIDYFDKRQPFRPFVVHLGSGKTYQIKKPEEFAYLQAARSLFVFLGDRSWTSIELNAIEAIDSLSV